MTLQPKRVLPDSDSVLLRERGRALHMAGNLDDAENCYRQVLLVFPDDAEALHLSGLVSLARGDLLIALPQLHRAVEILSAPQHLANLSMGLNAAGRHDEAARVARRALATKPDYPEALNNLGLAHANRGRLRQAATAYRAAVAARPNYAEAYVNLAVTLSHLHEVHAAEMAFRAAFAEQPSLHPNHNSGVGQGVLFVSGEENSPGSIYRCARMSASLKDAGWQTRWLPLTETGDDCLSGLKAIIFWRVQMTALTSRLIARARAADIIVGLDIDDLIIDPDIASVRVVDGIRTLRHKERDVRRYFSNVRAVLEVAHFGLASTAALARHMRAPGRPAFVVPNGFDDGSYRAARAWRRRFQSGSQDGKLRIGYAAGTRTHQRDMIIASGALARLLACRAHACLVLFRDPNSGEGLLLLDEFPKLVAFADRIEWRDMVRLQDLPGEIARFDINIAPLELSNDFTNAKSELKYFEAALAEVPTIAAPTEPFAEAIEHGCNGMLAATEDEWFDCLAALADDMALRNLIGRRAYLDTIARFGPNRRSLAIARCLAEVTGDPLAAMAAQPCNRPTRPAPSPSAAQHIRTVFTHDKIEHAEVTVVIPLFNYAQFIEDALQSVATQTMKAIDLIIVDDGSTDRSLDLAKAWAAENAARFNRLLLLANYRNRGLAATRNAGFELADTLLVLPLDADNRLKPACCERLAAAMQNSAAGFAYPSLHKFGAETGVTNNRPYTAAGLAYGNYIDALALVRLEAWASVGGYHHIDHGWEDYDFWCRLAEHGYSGLHVPEVLAEYRVHTSSMLYTSTDVAANKAELIADMRRRHPWLSLP